MAAISAATRCAPGAQSRVAEQRVDGARGRGVRGLRRCEAQSGAGGGDALCVQVLVGALGQHEQREPVSESSEHRPRAAMGDHGIAARKQLGLRDEAANVDIVGLSAVRRGIAVDTERDDDVDRVRGKGREDHSEGVEVTVPQGAEGDIDRHGMGARGARRGQRRHAHRDRRHVMDRGQLQRRRAGVEVQMLVESPARMRRKARRHASAARPLDGPAPRSRAKSNGPKP